MDSTRVLVPAFRLIQKVLYGMGFDLQRFSPAKGIPDADLYGPYLQPWMSAAWQMRLRAGDPASLVTPDRKYLLWQFASQCAGTVEGDFFECGVYHGGTAYLLADILSSGQKHLHLFDTFSGMPDVSDRDLHNAGDFHNTSLNSVKTYLEKFDRIQFHPGFVPETFNGLEQSKIAFAHIDLDIYTAIRDATAFIYPRLSRGGIILYDDYGLPTCPGARQAVEEFFGDKPESVVALKTGQGLVIKA